MLKILIIVGVIIVLITVLLTACYVKASPAVAYVISGLGKGPRFLIGRGGFRIPFLERLDKVHLSQISIDVKTDRPVPTSDFIMCECDGVAVISVSQGEEGIRKAARNFLNLTPEAIASRIKETLQGNMREIIGKIDLKTLNTDRESFSKQVQESATKDLDLMGISVISFNLQNVKDQQGLIEALGADNTYKIRQNAAITKAEAEKNIARAEAENKQKANEARVESEKAIAEQNNELALRQSELKIISDSAKADADVAYEIQHQEKQKIVNIKKVEAEIERTRQEKVLSREQIEIEQNKLSAEVEKKADADKYKTEQEAQANLEQRKRKAEAERYEAEQQALAENARNDAKRYEAEQQALGIKAKGDAEAAAILAKGQAEAEVIRAKLEAEATGMDRKAEAYKKYNDVALAQMLIEKLPEVAKSISESVAGIEGINIYSTDGKTADAVTGMVPIILKQTLDTMTSATGVDMASLIKANTIEAKTDRNLNISAGTTPVVEIK